MVTQTINAVEAERLAGFIFKQVDENKVRNEKIKKLKERNNVLQAAVEEFMDNGKQIDELRNEEKEVRKLIDTLISFAEKSSGEEFKDNGPLYRNGGELEKEV